MSEVTVRHDSSGTADIVEQRHRDPIIAAVIRNIGLIIACLLPLAVAVFVIQQMQSQEPDHAAVAELLVLELTADQPGFLRDSLSPRQALIHNDEAAAHHALIAGESTDDMD